jgi:RNA polymerase sigma-70 factor (ECF subfamily)
VVDVSNADSRQGSTEPAERFALAYEQCSEPILRYFLRRLSSIDAAADATADVFVVAWRRIAEMPDGNESRLWLFGVARLTLQNEMRRRRRHDTLTERLRIELAASRTQSHADGANGSLQTAMDMLSESDRELLRLTGWDGLTPSEAAHVLNIEPHVARVRLHRARGRLRDFLSEEFVGVEKRPGATGTCGSQGAACAPSSPKEIA